MPEVKYGQIFNEAVMGFDLGALCHASQVGAKRGMMVRVYDMVGNLLEVLRVSNIVYTTASASKLAVTLDELVKRNAVNCVSYAGLRNQLISVLQQLGFTCDETSVETEATHSWLSFDDAIAGKIEITSHTVALSDGTTGRVCVFDVPDEEGVALSYQDMRLEAEISAKQVALHCAQELLANAATTEDVRTAMIILSNS